MGKMFDPCGHGSLTTGRQKFISPLRICLGSNVKIVSAEAWKRNYISYGLYAVECVAFPESNNQIAKA